MGVLLGWMVSAALGATSSPQAAVVGPWPMTLDFDFCWGAPTCAFTSPGDETLTVAANGTFQASDGNTGTWTFERRARRVRLRFDGTQTAYAGVVRQGCVRDGTITIGGVPAGTWSGCVR